MSGWIVVEMEDKGKRGFRAKPLSGIVHATKEAAEAEMQDQISADSMFNDRALPLVVVPNPYIHKGGKP